MVNGKAKAVASFDFGTGMAVYPLVGSHGTNSASAATAAANRVAAANPDVSEE